MIRPARNDTEFARQAICSLRPSLSVMALSRSLAVMSLSVMALFFSAMAVSFSLMILFLSAMAASLSLSTAFLWLKCEFSFQVQGLGATDTVQQFKEPGQRSVPRIF